MVREPASDQAGCHDHHTPRSPDRRPPARRPGSDDGPPRDPRGDARPRPPPPHHLTTARSPASPAASPATSTSTRSSCGWRSWCSLLRRRRPDRCTAPAGCCVPEDGTDEAKVRLDDRSRTVALVVVGALAALALLGDSWGGWGFPWPLAIIGLIVAIVLSARRHRDPAPPPAPPGHPTRHRPSRRPRTPAAVRSAQPRQPAQARPDPVLVHDGAGRPRRRHARHRRPRRRRRSPTRPTPPSRSPSSA